MAAEEYVSEVTEAMSSEERAARVLGGFAVLALLAAGAWWLSGVGGMILFVAWLAWWVWGVNWQRAWAFLAQGAWIPLVLLVIISALAWSQIAPSDCTCLGFTTVRNFWWQLGAVGLLTCTALFCGWLQGALHWQPAEVELEPAEEAHGHEHGHGHH
jgi:hypothetical protein